jgi:hypothetical protein
VAVLTGIGMAWLVRGMQAIDPVAPTPPDPFGFVVGDGPTSHATLAAAIAAAADCDTVSVYGDGPFVAGPVSVKGKALTIRAAPGSHPVLTFAAPPAAWQALLMSDSPLSLDGIELRRGQGGGPAQLVYATGDSLRLTNCHLNAEGHSAPVVARGVGRIEVRNCHFLAGGLALCAEVGHGTGCAVTLDGSRIEVGDKGAAAVSVWAREQSAAPVTIELTGNEVHAARVLSLGELRAGVTIMARGNRFDFNEALLCVNGFGEGWRRAVRWDGQDNQYHGADDWVCVEGRAAGGRELLEPPSRAAK